MIPRPLAVHPGHWQSHWHGVLKVESSGGWRHRALKFKLQGRPRWLPARVPVHAQARGLGLPHRDDLLPR
eukprot:3307373-Rhodomonas_salina.1